MLFSPPAGILSAAVSLLGGVAIREGDPFRVGFDYQDDVPAVLVVILDQVAQADLRLTWVHK